MTDSMELALSHLDRAARKVVEIVLGAKDKEPEELSDLERVAIAIGGGADYEFTDTGMRVKEPFAIQKINGQFIVRVKRS